MLLVDLFHPAAVLADLAGNAAGHALQGGQDFVVRVDFRGAALGRRLLLPAPQPPARGHAHRKGHQGKQDINDCDCHNTCNSLPAMSYPSPGTIPGEEARRRDPLCGKIDESTL